MSQETKYVMSGVLSLGNGQEFVVPSDWRQYLSDALQDRTSLPYYDVNPKYDYLGNDRLVHDLYEKLRGTGEEIALANAALELIETGSPSEMYAARVAPYEHAPSAYDRLLEVVASQKQRLVAARVLENVLATLLRLRPTDVRGIDALVDEITVRSTPYLIQLAAQYAPEWLARNLPDLSENLNPAGLIANAPEGRRAVLVDAIARKGGEYVRRVVDQIEDPTNTPKWRDLLTSYVQDNPVFVNLLRNRTQSNREVDK